MNLLNDLISRIKTSHPVQDITVGLFTTLVASRNIGLASTCFSPGCHASWSKEAVNLAGQDSRQLAGLVHSAQSFQVSIGMAALNSALPLQNLPLKEKNAVEILQEKGQDKTVAVIGHFPFLDRLRPQFKNLYIFEKKPQPGDLTVNEMAEFLPRAEVVALTGMTIMNQSFSSIMEYVDRKSFVIVLGPSTPLSPVLFDYGVDVIAGSIGNDLTALSNQIKQAFSFKNLTALDYFVLDKE